MSELWIYPILFVTLLFVWVHGSLVERESPTVALHSAITLLWIFILLHQITDLIKG